MLAVDKDYSLTLKNCINIIRSRILDTSTKDITFKKRIFRWFLYR